MVSRFQQFPKEILALQAAYLNEEQVVHLLASDLVLQKRLTYSSEYAQLRFESEFTTDKTWLKQRFLVDEGYRDSADSTIPASAFNYYEGLREARMLTDMSNINRGMRIIFQGLDGKTARDVIGLTNKGCYFSCRNNFDLHLIQKIRHVQSLKPSLLGKDLIIIIGSLVRTLTQECMRYNRLTVFKALVEFVKRDSTHLIDIFRVVHDGNTPLLDGMCFDQAFYEYLVSNAFQPWNSDVLRSFAIARALYYSDYERFLALTENIVELREHIICSNDNLDFFKAMTITDPNHILAYCIDKQAEKILTYMSTLPLYVSLIRNILSFKTFATHLTLCYFTPVQLQNFFVNVFPRLLTFDWSTIYRPLRRYADGDEEELDGLEVTMISNINSSNFQANYRTIMRMHLPHAKVKKVINAIYNLTKPLKVVSDDDEYSDTSNAGYYRAMLLFTQEFIRVDLVTQPQYRVYLAYIHDKMPLVQKRSPLGQFTVMYDDWAVAGFKEYNNVQQYINAKRSNGPVFAYLLFFTYYYLINKLPFRYYEILEDYNDTNIVSYRYSEPVLVARNTNRLSLQIAHFNPYQVPNFTARGIIIRPSIQDIEWLAKYV